jgi:hypothetical protein
MTARALSSGHNAAVSSTLKTNVEELASSRAFTTRQALPSPSNYPNVSSGVISQHHSVAVKPTPDPLEIRRNLGIVRILYICINYTTLFII